MPIAPQVNLETYSSRIYTCRLTLPSIAYGKLYNTVNDGGSAMTGSGSHSIQYVGTSAQVNVALDNTKFEPAADVVLSPFNITYLQSDDNDTGTPGSNIFNGTMEITIRDTHTEFALNNSNVSYTEDTDGTINIGAITDLRPDNIDSNIQYTATLTLNDLTAWYSGPTGWNNQGAQGGDGPFTYTGTKAQCNTKLSSVNYRPHADYNSPFTITYNQFQLTDGIDQGDYVINMTGVANDEFNISGTARTYEEDTTSIWNIGSITDVRSDTISPNLQYTMRLYVSNMQAGVFFGWTEAADHWSFTGIKADCNAELANVTFIPDPDFTGPFTYQYHQIQNSNGLDQGWSSVVNVSLLTSHGENTTTASQTYTEDQRSTWNIGAITDLRPDNIDPNIQYTVTLTVNDPLALDAIDQWTGPQGGPFTYTGTKAQVNLELATASVTPGADYISNFSYTVNYNQDTNSINQGTSGTIAVTNIGTSAENTTTASQTYTEDTTMVWNVGSILDGRFDWIDNTIEYTVVLTFNDFGAIESVTGWTGAGSYWEFTGTKTAVNAALAAVSIKTKPDYTSTFGYTVNYNQNRDNIDQGTSALVNVTNTISHDEFIIAPSQVYTEDTTATWNVGSITDLALSKNYRSTITFSDPGAGVLTGWTNAGGGVFTFEGTQAEINAELSTVEFIPIVDYDSNYTYTYQQQQTTDNIDQGTTGAVSVTVTAHNEFSVSAAQSYRAGTTATWNVGSITDLAVGKTYTITMEVAGTLANWTINNVTEDQNVASVAGGYHLDMSTDGQWAAVGKRFYKYDGSDWVSNYTYTLIDDAEVVTSRAIDQGGYTIVSGADGEDTGGTDTGAVYVNQRHGPKTKLKASDDFTGDKFGHSVDISNDATTIIVGTKIPEVWQPQLTGTISLTEGSNVVTGTGTLFLSELSVGDYGYFGSGMRIVESITSNTNLTVTGTIATTQTGQGIYPVTGGEGKAYIYTTPGDSNITGTLNSMTATNTVVGVGTLFTSELSITDEIVINGNRYGIGAITDDTNLTINGGVVTEAADATPKRRPQMNWTEQAILQGSDKLGGDEFGYSVVLSADGNTAAIGARQWGNKQASNAWFGDGGVYIFTRSGSVWTEQQKIQGSLLDSNTTGRGHGFGWSVDLSDDGDTLIVGSPSTGYGISGYDSNDGWAYIFTRSGGVWSEEDLFRDEEFAGSAEQYGFGVHISGDGSTAIASDYFDIPTDAGNAYLYSKINNDWSLKHEITRSGTQIAGEHFGQWGGLNYDGSRFILSTEDRGWFAYSNTGGLFNQYTFTGTKASCNAELASVEYTHFGGLLADFTASYAQNQDTDGLDQGGTTISITRSSAATYTRQGPNHGAITGTYSSYAGGTISDIDDAVGDTKLYTLRLAHTGQNVTGYNGINATYSTFAGQTLTIVGTINQINNELSGFSIYIDTDGQTAVNLELDDDTNSETVVSTGSYNINSVTF